MPLVLNKHDCVFIGRPSKWGNPFVIGKDGNREEVIRKYKNYLRSKPELIYSLPELEGKNLICYCSPLACHGDILLLLSNNKQELKKFLNEL